MLETIVILLVLMGGALIIIPRLRIKLLSGPILKLIKKKNFIPKVSSREEEALAAGSTWHEKQFFSGKLDFEELTKDFDLYLTPEEQEFLDIAVDRICGATEDWPVWLEGDLSDDTWKLLKELRVFGMSIPKEFGGLEFSPAAQSAVIAKLASRSIPLAVTAMVPNSLGPGELLIRYGTTEQKERYLSGLASGEEIPSFCLTETEAGSDASNVESEGILYNDDSGNPRFRLSWDKRWSTLAPVATVLAIAFRLKDPDRLLGHETDLGITLALVPTNLAGVETGPRHDPLGVPFLNGPTRGTEVDLPLDAIVGDREGAGKGWGMLMECLAAGRGISLPAMAAGSCRQALATVSAHTYFRKQFGLPLARFEGVTERLARIAGLTYSLDALREYVLGALAEKAPSMTVASIAKLQSTELGRAISNDVMDLMAGTGISCGPQNQSAHHFISQPIGITTEGANILTRTLMIFGQGSLRAHPQLPKLFEAMRSSDKEVFDDAVIQFFRHFCASTIRCTWGWLTGYFNPFNKNTWKGGLASKTERRLNRSATTFAWLADLTFISLGPALKKKEHHSGRLADILVWQITIVGILRRWQAAHSNGNKKETSAISAWAVEHGFWQIEQAIDSLLASFPGPLTWIMRFPVRYLWRLHPLSRPPSDSLANEVAKSVTENQSARADLVKGRFVGLPHEIGQKIESAYESALSAKNAMKKLKEAQKRESILNPHNLTETIEQAKRQGILTDSEANLILKAESTRESAMQVDEFHLGEGRWPDWQPRPSLNKFHSVGSESKKVESRAGPEPVMH